MELKQFEKDLRKLKEGEKIILGFYLFYIQDNEYHVYDTEEKKEINRYEKKDWLLILNDFRFSIARHSEKELKRREKIVIEGKIKD